MVRVGAYIDGFNLYHAIDELRKPWLKWLNLWALCRSLLKEDEELLNVAYFSAVLHSNAEKRARHLEFIRALKAVGVQTRLHGFKKARKYCEREDRYCEFKEEKQTDVAFAVSLVSDAYRGTFDRAILVTADSDYIPAVEHLRDKFPALKLTLAAPPGRLQKARDLGNVVTDRLEISAGHLGACMFPQNVSDGNGKVVARRPAPYAPK